MDELIQVYGQPRGWAVWATDGRDAARYVKQRIEDLDEVKVKPTGLRRPQLPARRFVVYEKQAKG
jgi:hypothetical protein